MRRTVAKKILFISPVGEFYGGGERSGFEFCKFLAESGHQIITAIPKSSKSYVEELKKNNMDYRLLDCNDFECQVLEGSGLAFSKVISQLVALIKEEHIDLVITNLYAQCGPIAASLSDTPNISMDRGQAYTGECFSNFMVKFSDAIIVNSMGLADIYNEKYGIHTPISYSYTPTPKVGLDEDIKEQRIVCVSRISPEKDLLEVLKAAVILKKNNMFDGKILMIGPTPGPTEKQYQKELEAYALENDLSNNIQWLGNQQTPWKFVGQNDIYLNTSEKESIGRSNIEAIKLGVPVILADIPGHKDIFEKIGATKYTPNNTDELVEKINYIIKNPLKAKKDAAKARLKAEQVINETNCYKEVLPLIDSLGSETSITSDKVFNYALALINDLRANIAEKEAIHSSEISQKNEEIASFLGIKRSSRILLGNIKRKIIRILQ